MVYIIQSDECTAKEEKLEALQLILAGRRDELLPDLVI
jgi:hypothetical protein